MCPQGETRPIGDLLGFLELGRKLYISELSSALFSKNSQVYHPFSSSLFIIIYLFYLIYLIYYYLFILFYLFLPIRFIYI